MSAEVLFRGRRASSAFTPLVAVRAEGSEASRGSRSLREMLTDSLHKRPKLRVAEARHGENGEAELGTVRRILNEHPDDRGPKRTVRAAAIRSRSDADRSLVAVS